ncbi:MAG: N,N-dimethylformamidase beta subunit, partial [Alphaproteobacteria bacterium MarineAlpha10_Bin1]
MLRITGYSDRYALCPGEEIKFYINSENGESYNADIVRMIHGDTNPDGPGFKVEELDTQVSKEYAGRNQIIHGGSYAVVPHDHRMNVESFTLQAFIFPTTPD